MLFLFLIPKLWFPSLLLLLHHLEAVPKNEMGFYLEDKHTDGKQSERRGERIKEKAKLADRHRHDLAKGFENDWMLFTLLSD